MSETTANFLEIPKGASQDMTFLTMKAGSMAYRFSYLRKSCDDHVVENLEQDQYDMYKMPEISRWSDPWFHGRVGMIFHSHFQKNR